jgi:hypothetical protein
MKNQTAIEWLELKIDNVLSNLPIERECINNFILEAKKIEEHHIKNAHYNGFYDSRYLSNKHPSLISKEYYNETFEK